MTFPQNLEFRILHNFAHELSLFKSKAPSSLIKKWFSLKKVPQPLHSLDTFKHQVRFIGHSLRPKYSGPGIIIYPSSSEPKVYIGEFKRGRRHGRGWRLLNKTIFCGEYKRDSKEGPAEIFAVEGDRPEIVFKGQFLQGKMHGKCFVKDDNHEFDGYIHFGLYQGKCQIKYSNGDRYSGDMIKGRISGKGEIRYANGDKYSGNFLNNERTGEGAYTWNSRKNKCNFSSDLSSNDTLKNSYKRQKYRLLANSSQAAQIKMNSFY